MLTSGSLHPRNLQIQMDNCFRENKNLTMFGFAALLMNHDVYETVTLSCVIQDHTHEDIDQMFSTWFKYYWTHTLESFGQLQQFVNCAYPEESIRPSVYNM